MDNETSTKKSNEADKLSALERAQMSRVAAATRLGVPLADFMGETQIGSWVMRCAHLADGRRVISQRSFMDLLEMKGRGSDPGHRIANLIDSGHLNSRKMMNLRLAIRKPILFIPTDNAQLAYGYEGTLIVDFCEAIMDLRSYGAMEGEVMKRYASAAERFIRSLAKTGIVAIIDEATGFQEIRQKDTLARILEQFIAGELQPWTKTFPEQFYREIYRLRKWDWKQPRKFSRPAVLGHWTNDFVYDRLAPGVRAELCARNPKLDSGRRKDRHHQWLTGEVGHPQLKSLLDGVVRLLQGSRSWGEFKRYLDRFYPKLTTTDLGFEVMVSRRPQRLESESPASTD